MNERELSLKIKDYLNRGSLDFKFKFIDDFCDIADEKNKIYIEVKPDHFAPAQLLHAIAKKGIKDAKYLGVADNIVVKLFSPPSFEKILAFATSFDPRLVFAPNQVDKPELNEQAEKILGDPEKIIKLEFSTSQYLFINRDNINSIKLTLDKYRVELDLLANWLDGVGECDSIKVNKDGWLVNTDKPEIFTNEKAEEKKAKELTEFGGFRRPKHIAIRPNDISFFESLRIKHEDLADVLHEVDRLLSRIKRRESGVFWTEREIGDMLADEIIQLISPDYVVEPCVGGGSLIEKIVPLVKGAMNDISTRHVENCKKIFDGYDWKFTTFDIVNTMSDILLRSWDVPKDKKLLLYTNPPFGTSSASRLMSEKEEMIGKTSRRLAIKCPPGLEKYGKGDLFIPIVGRLIEIAKIQKTCYLAFFAPFGLFCGRGRYMNLFTALTRDFCFLKGYVFAGYNFHDINKTLPIALTIWKYKPNAYTQHLDLNFDFIDRSGTNKKIEFKKIPLIKDRWRYRDGNKYVKNKTKSAISVPRCDAFNVPNIKNFGINLAEGSGAELSPDNLKSNEVLVPNVPSELVYGLWSVAVGKHVFGTSLSTSLHPIYFEQAYVHLPDFSKKETIEILAYSALHVLIKNYAEDKIGFFGTNKVFRFGGERLTKGVDYLFSLCKDCHVYDGYTISEVFELIKQSKVDITKCRKGIKDEVSKRLNQIGYWDYVPIPRAKIEKVKTI
jgi:hypothetical protein